MLIKIKMKSIKFVLAILLSVIVSILSRRKFHGEETETEYRCTERKTGTVATFGGVRIIL